MGQAITPVFDTEAERIKEQLAQADALRKVGMEGNTGSGYHGGRVFIVGNPLGNIAASLGGAFLGDRARTRQGELEQQQTQERQDWLNQMPSGTETQHYDPMSNPGTGPLAEGMEVPQSPRALANAMRQWATQAPRGMEGVQNFSIQQQMLAPEKEADRAVVNEQRKFEVLTKAEEAAKLQREKLEDLARRDRERAQDRQDNIRLMASLRPAAAPHKQVVYGPDGQAYSLDMTTDKTVPLPGIGKPAKSAIKSLPVKAQGEYAALQNLDSATKAYETLLKDYNPQSSDPTNLTKRAAIKAAFTDLQMRQKEAFALGAITGPDMQVLEGAYTDPTGLWGSLRGVVGGNAPFQAQIDQGRAALNRTKKNFEQQYKTEIPEPAGTFTEPMPGTAATQGYADAAKERRYQEWKARQAK